MYYLENGTMLYMYSIVSPSPANSPKIERMQGDFKPPQMNLISELLPQCFSSTRVAQPITVKTLRH